MNIQACPVKPQTRQSTRTDTIHGMKVEDNYRWLESDTDERETWLNDQMQRSDCHLDAYPNHGDIKERLLTVFRSQKQAFEGELKQGDGFQVQWKRAAGAQYHTLNRIDAGSQDPQIIFDPNQWPKGETLGWTTMSPDKQFLAYGRVLNGMDVGRMEIMDLKSGDVVSTLEGAKATDAPTWAGNDDKLYFSARKGPAGFVSYDVSDAEVTQKAPGWLAPYGDIAEHNGSVLYTTNAPTYLDEEAVFITPQGQTLNTNIPTGRMTFSSHGTNVFIQTTAEAPNGQVLMLDMSKTEQGAAPESKVLIPEVEGRTINSVAALDNAVAVAYSNKALPGLAVYDLEGNVKQEVPLGGPGALSSIRSDDDGNLRFTWSTLIQPSVEKKLDMKTGEISVVKEAQIPGFDPADFTTERKWYTSADGTEVPLTLAYKNGLELNGENPAHIYVYGGFRSAVEPYFSATRLPFLEAGGVYAIAHVRGGDELGEEWHDQATGLNRTKVYDDVAGAAKFLAQAGYSSAQHTSLEGASNGGLVTGVAVTRNPELFQAAVAEVGLHDMARYEEMGGTSWNQEYGSIRDKDEAGGLLSWSPYHNVKAGIDYPAVLVTTGKHDDRVDPAHSFKFAAKMQEVETSHNPVYLRIEENLGHGHGATDEQWADRYADQWAFLLGEIGDREASAAA